MRRAIFMAMTVLLVASGCSTTGDIKRPARLRAQEAGRPLFDLEAGQAWSDGQGQVVVLIGLPRAALVYARRGSSYVASYEAALRVRPEEREQVAAEAALSDTLRFSSYEATQSLHSVHHRRALHVPPGAYVVEVTVTDDASRETVTRRRRVRVAPPEEGAAMSRLRLTARPDTGAAAPILADYLSERSDSVRAALSLFHLRRADTMRVRMRLLRFPRDTAAARPPHWLMPSRASLAYQGVRLRRPDTLQRTRRMLTQPERRVQLTFTLPHLKIGVYRVEVAARTAGAEPLRQKRTFTVRSAPFPRVRTLRQMIRALAYLADQDEMSELRAAEQPAERRRRFDRFWGKLIPHKQLAADVIRRYYSRVEEANRRYTTYKAGWKTDRGMIYILFGEPTYVDERATSLRWHYGYNERDPRDAFAFRRVSAYGNGKRFEHFVLLRKPYYERVWRRMIRRWRKGEVLY